MTSIGIQSRGPDFLVADSGPACQDEDPELFFPDRHTPVTKIDEARAVCARCRLRDQCRAWALGRHAEYLHGIWGGMTQDERREAQGRGQGRRR